MKQALKHRCKLNILKTTSSQHIHITNNCIKQVKQHTKYYDMIPKCVAYVAMQS